MAQIGKDYYEDLTAEKLSALIDALAAGQLPVPGPQNGRFSSEPLGGATALTGVDKAEEYNASAARAVKLRDTVKRIDGTEVPIITPWARRPEAAPKDAPQTEATPSAGREADTTGVTVQEAAATSPGKPHSKDEPAGQPADAKDTE